MTKRMFRKGDICFAEDIQGFGFCVVELQKKLKGIGVWECVFLAHSNQMFWDFYMRREDKITPMFDFRMERIS